MGFSMVLTTFFEDPKKASQLGYMIIFMGFIPYVIVSNILDSSQASSEIFILYGFGWIPTISILPIVELIIGIHSETNDRKNKSLDHLENIREYILVIYIIAIGNILVHSLLYLYFDQVFTHKRGLLFFARKLSEVSSSKDLNSIVEVNNLAMTYRKHKVLKDFSLKIS